MQKKWLIPLLSVTLILPTTLSVDAAKSPTIVTKYAKSKKDLKYPYISKGLSTKVRNKINADLTDFSKFAYKNYVETENLEKKAKKSSSCKKYPSMCDYVYTTTYEKTGDHPSYLTFALYDYTYKGDAHGFSYKYAVNYSLKTGKDLSINGVLKTSSQTKKVEKYIYNKLKNDPNYFVDKLSDIDITKDTQYIMNKNGIRVIFQQYEIASYVMGQPEVYVPKSVYQ